MYLYSKCFNVVGPIRSSSKVTEVELDLIPPFVKSHWHGANERLHSSGALIVGRSKSSSYVLVVQDLYFKGEVFL